MTTYISLAASATMVPPGNQIITSVLTPELVKARMQSVEVVSVLNERNQATIDAIKRRFDLELPLPVLAPGERAPQITLAPGDELFICQATLPRLREGEVHSDEVVNAAPISFIRWRVPIIAVVRGPGLFAEHIFAEIMDDAYAVALWFRGGQMRDAEALIGYVGLELKELEKSDNLIDAYLEAADVLYYISCHWYATEGKENEVFWDVIKDLGEFFLSRWNQAFSEVIAADVLLAKYGRRATGELKDVEVERELARPFVEEL